MKLDYVRKSQQWKHYGTHLVLSDLAELVNWTTLALSWENQPDAPS